MATIYFLIGYIEMAKINKNEDVVANLSNRTNIFLISLQKDN